MQVTHEFKPINSESAAAKGYETRKIYLNFHGPKGSTFGQELFIEINVNLDKNEEEVNMEELFRAAIYMSETLCVGTFDDCVEALKQCKGDQNAAVQHLIDRA